LYNINMKSKKVISLIKNTAYYLEEIPGCRVDLVVPDAIKPRMKPSILRDLIHVA